MDFFPVLFVVPRVVGWVAHWRQVHIPFAFSHSTKSLNAAHMQMMLSPSGVKIWRPRQLYLGPSTRDYVPLEERTSAFQVGVGMEPSVIEHSGYVRILMVGQNTESLGRMTKRRKLAEAAGKVRSKL
jgi:citrate synthase